MGLKDWLKSRRKSTQAGANSYAEEAPAPERQISLKVESLDGKTWDLQLSSNDFLSDLESKFEALSGIKRDDQAFWYRRKLIQDGDKVVEKMSLENGDTLLYTTPTISESATQEGQTTGPIRVIINNTLVQVSYLIDINLENTGMLLKEKYQDFTGIPPHQLVFRIAGGRFDDEKTIAEMGLKNASNIGCMIRLP